MKITKSFLSHRGVIIAVLTFCLAINSGISASVNLADTVEKKLVLFESDDLIEAEIRFDLSTYLKKKMGDQSLPGVITFSPGRPDSIQRSINIKTRGKFRLERCSFAPMEITFRKSVYAWSDSGKFKKIKLVTHCESGISYDDYILKEYLVYKLYNVLTDSSFRVRLMRIRYVDAENDRKPIIQYGFFIEPKAVMAARNRCMAMNSMNLTQKYMIPELMDRVAIFNYMVGGWDWAVQSQHNIAILRSMVYETENLLIPVPYDFDLTGVVDPHYNLPPPESGLKSNRDRMYMGLCREDWVFMENLKEFLKKRDEFRSVIMSFPYLSERSRKELVSYLEDFLANLERQRNIEYIISLFKNSCLNL